MTVFVVKMYGSLSFSWKMSFQKNKNQYPALTLQPILTLGIFSSIVATKLASVSTLLERTSTEGRFS